MKAKRILPVVLAGLLQLMPMLRMVIPLQEEGFAPSAWAIVLRLAGGTVAFLGSYHAVSAATAIVTPYTINATIGVPYSRQLTTSGQTAHSWSANTAPLGSTNFPLVPGLTLSNSNGKITGTPTVAITTNVTISAWENGGNNGASVSALFTITVTNSTGPPPPTTPVITTQPQSKTNYVGSNVTFTVVASGSAPLSYQWRFNGNPISTATASNYTLPNLQSSNAGNYSVTITNSAGSTNSANAALTVLVPSADLAVTSSGPASIVSGANFSYTVTVTNIGPTPAASVVVSDALPPGATFVSATGGGVVNAGVVTWPAITSLASGSASSFTVTVTAPVPGTLTNIASATSSTTDPNSANNNGSAAASRTVTSVVTPQADVAVICTGPANVPVSSAFDYTITVTNLGPNPAGNVVVSDALPGAVTFGSASGGGTFNSGTVTWPAIASLAAGASASFTVTVTAPASGTFTNSASSTSTTADPNAANNNGSAPASQVVTATVAAAQADIVAACSGPSSVAAGAAFSYTVSVTNLGPTAASNVVVSDSLPPSVVFSSTTGGGTLNNGIVTWPAIASFAGGSSASFTINVTAPTVGVTLTNTASESSPTPDPVPANNNGTAAASAVISVVQPQADLVVLKSGPTGVLSGSNVVYTITVTNLGPSIATNVVVSDNLPASAVFGSASGGAVLANRTLTWPTIASIAAGATASFTVTVTAPASGSFTNIASANSVTPDPNAANNNGTAPASQVITTVVSAQGQFGILIVTNGLNPQSGLFEETVTVTNTGLTTAAAVRLYVDGLRSGVLLNNAAGTSSGRPYVQYNAPLNPNQAVNLLLEFYVPDRGSFTASLSAIAVLPANLSTSSADSTAINRVFTDSISGTPRLVIEFSSVPGQTYTVIYSDNGLSNWLAATPSVTASATVTQWFDDGPPKTLSRPLNGGSRFYRVIANP